ncbi:sporulation protein [Alteribacter lacisalsi]|uniref:Sporulation protein n=1 Tax=Alteribacter lacisalsi TaxID=2045244 RepID=A0A2W0HCT3_9BACI|nr:DUF1360 domain-containing protein [Alteribacter lacisalsi]PYZ97750.1 sporulation protein [Alteribacter lacisalsi]
MEVTWLSLLMVSIAVFRLTHLVVYDSITEPLRNLFLTEREEEGEIFYEPREGWFRRPAGELLSCHWCTGFWVSLLLTSGFIWLPLWFGKVILFLAVAGIASIIHSAVIHYFF